MLIRNTVALGAAALFLSAGLASAATMHRPHHMSHKPMTHSMSRTPGASGTTTPTSADRSADQLNAQSLQRTQGQ